MRYKTVRLFIVCLVLALGAGAGRSVRADDDHRPGVAPFNREYAELSVQWWQWAYKQPVSTNPLFDTTGAAANNGQPRSGNVFFLAGLISVGTGLQAAVTRSITIPTGTRLFFPILNAEWDNVGVVPPLSIDQLRQNAAFTVDSILSLYCTIDGASVDDLSRFRTISPVFRYGLPPTDNIAQFFGFDASGTVDPAVGDGFYLLLNPLMRGPHVLRFGGTTRTLDNSGNPAVFSLDVTYYITVSPGGK